MHFSHPWLCHLLQRMWRKIWMVLYKPSSTGVGRLELYTHNNPFTEQKKGIWQKTPEKKVVRSSDCLSITPALTESCPPGCTAFYLTTTQCNFMLASTESKQWLSVLCLLTSQVTPSSPVYQLSHFLFSSLIISERSVQTLSETDSAMRKLLPYQ